MQLCGRIALCAGLPPARVGPDWKSRGGDARLPSCARCTSVQSCTSTSSSRVRCPPQVLRGLLRTNILSPASAGPKQRSRQRHGDCDSDPLSALHASSTTSGRARAPHGRGARWARGRPAHPGCNRGPPGGSSNIHADCARKTREARF